MLSPIIKKHIIKALTFFIFPKILRIQIKRHLRYFLGLMPTRPEFFYEHYIYYKTRQHFSDTYRKDLFSYRIISLGCNCFARTVPSLWGIKPRKNQGEVGYPFDLSNNYLEIIAKSIANDFKGYFKTLTFDNELNIWVTNNRMSQFCHEHDLTRNDKDKIIERFSQRIKNMQFVLHSDEKVALFINYFQPQYAPNDFQETYKLYNNLYNSLKTYRGDRKFKFLIVDAFGMLNKEPLSSEIELFSFKNLPQPYVWHLDECRCKPFGLNFEKQFIAKVLELLNQLQR